MSYIYLFSHNRHDHARICILVNIFSIRFSNLKKVFSCLSRHTTGRTLEHWRNIQQNTGISGGIRVRIPQELDVVAFWSWNLDVVVFQPWNLDVVAFCPLKKCLGITMSWVNCLRFSMSWLFGLGISMSWFFGLGISMSWYMCLHGLVFVFTKSIMPHN